MRIVIPTIGWWVTAGWSLEKGQERPLRLAEGR
jgi:hypothetical protein